MSRIPAWLLVLALVVAACGDGDPVAAARDDAREAPDFELALADGDTFRLSAESRPVYLIFWAEW